MSGDLTARDVIAHWLANWCLNHIATREYRHRLEATYSAGVGVWRHPDVADLLLTKMKGQADA